MPLVLLPNNKDLVLIRSTHHGFPIEHLKPEQVELVNELSVNDAFDGESGNEYAAVSVIRAVAMLATPTCDLEQPDGVWTVWPLKPVENSGLDIGNLNAGKYSNLVLLPEHRHVDRSFIDLTDLRQIRPAHFPRGNRVASVTREALDLVLEKFHATMGRLWGYAEGERVEPLAKYETGRYRCARCNLYDIEIATVTISAGGLAPECPGCKKLGRDAQWYPLTRHRKG